MSFNINKDIMNQDEFVIFAELHRDYFDEILQSLTEQFKHIQSGRQGDDWIWIHLGEDKIENRFVLFHGAGSKGKTKALHNCDASRSENGEKLGHSGVRSAKS